MVVDKKPVQDYIHALEKELAGGNTTEHSHRPALKALLESLVQGIIATNEPQHIINCGAPDFLVHKNKLIVGYVETKDIGKDLDAVLKTDQLQKYLASLHNLVLTNYLEFRWYVQGSHRLTVWLGTSAKDSKIKLEKDGVEKVLELLDGFLNHEPEPVGTAKELASHMSRLALMIRNMTVNTLKAELATGSLHAQLLAFRENLLPDLSIEQFADMYAQTIAYGLFAARCEADSGKDFSREHAEHLIPKTNPFLRQLFHHIAFDLDDQIVWAVDDLVQILKLANMEQVLKDFGKPNVKEDPVVHFYETFLKAYNPAMRKMRGVYYTPTPVVSYIVRSIDSLLKTRFGKPQGLADPSVLILDPAVGTATFLYMVIQEIHNAILSQGQMGTWNDYVSEKLLPRLFGFELLMAPYSIAHFKLGLLLKDLGYHFQADKRLGIYLTNTLEEAIKKSEMLTGFNKYIVDEANAAAEIKKEKPIMVVLGNPPYSGHSANKGVRAKELVKPYYTVDGKPLGEKNPKWLQDDYVKFIAFGQWRIDKTGEGILAFITNHSYLDNPTFRGMRQSLMNSFTDIYILNLHGNAKKKERTPDGGKDENVFDIQQGVSIGIFVKDALKNTPAIMHYADLWGLREGKYATLSETDINTVQWVELKPTSPYYLFVPQDTNLVPEYKQGWKVTEVFPVNVMGIQTHRDHLVIDSDVQKLRQRINILRQSDLSDEDLAEKLDVKSTKNWSFSYARKELAKDENWDEYFMYCLYRPFDVRSFYYTKVLVDRPRFLEMQHILSGSKALLLPRGVGGQWQHIFVTNALAIDVAISSASREANQVFPLYLYPIEKKEQPDKSGGKEGGTIEPLKLQENREPNLNPKFIAEIEKRLGIPYQPHPQSPSPSTERGRGEVAPTERGRGEVAQRGRGEVKWRTEPQLWEKLKPMARQMRKEPTEAEELLWQCLRNRQLLDFKFRRQHSVERFIVDFYCAEAGLVIEVDGPIHQYQKEEDFIRQTFIENQGLHVMRFSNDDVLNKLDTVIQQIIDALPHPHPSPSTERELGGEVTTAERGLGGEVLTPEDIFNYAYAVFHSPTYRSRYAEFLKIDFPRLPLTSNRELFKSLVAKGAELVSLHLMESPSLGTFITTYNTDGDNAVEKVAYNEKEQRVYINKTQFFGGVLPEVWNFHIGGYQVAEKWLKDRQKAHRKLSIDDINHYQKIIVALKETIRLMQEIDAVIPGWPIT